MTSGKRFSGNSSGLRSICSKTRCAPVGFVPPAPFTLDELDPSGLLPERPYTKDELQRYLDHDREKCRAVIEAFTDEKARAPRRISSGEVNGAELLLYNMRHVQHHVPSLISFSGSRSIRRLRGLPRVGREVSGGGRGRHSGKRELQ